MTQRINQKDLEILVNKINRLTNSPMSYCDKVIEQPFKANIGHYYLDWAYGGVKLERVHNEQGGCITVSTGGYGTKRALYQWMTAFISGLSNQEQQAC